MKEEYLRMWHFASKQDENPDLGKWDKVIAIVQAAFRGVDLVEPCTCQTVVLIPKGGGTDFWGLGLVEVLCKAISGIISRRLSSSIQSHEVLHGFCVGRGKGTATLKANLLQQIITMRETVPHAIFLDMIKAYDALDR